MRGTIATAKLGAQVTRSNLENRFLTLIAEKGLPRPEVNVRVAGLEVDCCWRKQRVIVELDGHAAHGARAGFERDRERDRKLHAAGWRPVRVTWRQIADDADGVSRDVAAMLGAAG